MKRFAVKYSTASLRAFIRRTAILARIRVTLPQEVLPEMTTDVAIQVARKESALLIPLTSIREGAVTVYRGGKKITVRANIGAIDGAWGEVLDDSIAPTDEIVIMKKQ